MSEIRSQATPARDELVHILAGAVLDNPGGIGTLPQHAADRLLAAGWSKPHTVNSAAELDALPVGSVVWTQALVGPVGHIFVKCARMWIIPWHDTAEDPLEQNGSVTVLFTPGDAG
ncbi:hypothetical protein [Rhodococcus sp. RCBS9]|uniref:hypothetical protein n=1 Tax=Rhodococcus sp. RCBS9 TaxID=3031999 RepID=UPI002402D8AB|nr:hypothetical protein [Rhodococcus sp. RCBS9]WEX03834.1 hypothetical protein P0M12_30225 [Rhodococcus sp. RCBS9]WEX03913.1 hypothetical protein P0M12_00240 [Rhodococcus sp. RCBS9]